MSAEWVAPLLTILENVLALVLKAGVSVSDITTLAQRCEATQKEIDAKVAADKAAEDAALPRPKPTGPPPGSVVVTTAGSTTNGNTPSER